MPDSGESKGSFFTSLPGILTGAAALITAISGLTFWHNSKVATNDVSKPGAVVERADRPKLTGQAGTSSQTPGAEGTKSDTTEKQAKAVDTSGSSAGSPPAPQTREWCAQRVAEWSAEMAKGTDDAGVRKAFREGHCGSYGLRLGRPEAK